MLESPFVSCPVSWRDRQSLNVVVRITLLVIARLIQIDKERDGAQKDTKASSQFFASVDVAPG